jgi:hypothetical protein
VLGDEGDPATVPLDAHGPSTAEILDELRAERLLPETET